MEVIKLKRVEAEEFEDYFKDCGREYFDCGEGYYETDVTIYVQTPSGKIYQVNMTANCEGNKTDYGDRIYFVEAITSVTYSEISRLQLVIWSLDELECERADAVNKLRDIDKKILELADEASTLKGL